jgi:hypothetical protein
LYKYKKEELQMIFALISLFEKRLRMQNQIRSTEYRRKRFSSQLDKYDGIKFLTRLVSSSKPSSENNFLRDNFLLREGFVFTWKMTVMIKQPLSSESEARRFLE